MRAAWILAPLAVSASCTSFPSDTSPTTDTDTDSGAVSEIPAADRFDACNPHVSRNPVVGLNPQTAKTLADALPVLAAQAEVLGECRWTRQDWTLGDRRWTVLEGRLDEDAKPEVLRRRLWFGEDGTLSAVSHHEGWCDDDEEAWTWYGQRLVDAAPGGPAEVVGACAEACAERVATRVALPDTCAADLADASRAPVGRVVRVAAGDGLVAGVPRGVAILTRNPARLGLWSTDGTGWTEHETIATTAQDLAVADVTADGAADLILIEPDRVSVWPGPIDPSDPGDPLELARSGVEQAVAVTHTGGTDLVLRVARTLTAWSPMSGHVSPPLALDGPLSVATWRDHATDQLLVASRDTLWSAHLDAGDTDLALTIDEDPLRSIQGEIQDAGATAYDGRHPGAVFVHIDPGWTGVSASWAERAIVPLDPDVGPSLRAEASVIFDNPTVVADVDGDGAQEVYAGHLVGAWRPPSPACALQDLGLAGSSNGVLWQITPGQAGQGADAVPVFGTTVPRAAIGANVHAVDLDGDGRDELWVSRDATGHDAIARPCPL